MGPKYEDIFTEGKYSTYDNEFEENKNNNVVWTITKPIQEEERVYTYDEAINLTGNGWYNLGLLGTLTLAILAMVLDMFGFAMVVSASTCDLQLEYWQTSTLLSIPLLGSILMAYAWGYISDTQGRQKSLSIALWGSFILASLSAFSPNWIVLAVLKFFASSLSSGAQSMGYTLLGESCCVKTKGVYMIILTCALVLAYFVFAAHGYIVLSFDFAVDLGYIIFKPWRLLILTLAMTLGLSAFLVSFFYESPKFLVNAGRITEAIKILRKIKKRNCGDDVVYPVKKIVRTDVRSDLNDLPLLTSLWKQTAPLFLPPMLKNTLLLFYITAAIYLVNNGFFLWIPVLVGSFFEDVPTNSSYASEGFCDIISLPSSNSTSSRCVETVNTQTLLTALVQGLVYSFINLIISRFAHRKKVVLISVTLSSSMSCFALLAVSDKVTSIILFFGVTINALGMGVLFSYFVDLYPTSYRGMISCLGVMVARSSGLAGANLIGAFIFSDCTMSLCIWGSYTLSAALVAFLLPPDKAK